MIDMCIKATRYRLRTRFGKLRVVKSVILTIARKGTLETFKPPILVLSVGVE
jgi:hypothetical protein